MIFNKIIQMISNCLKKSIQTFGFYLASLLFIALFFYSNETNAQVSLTFTNGYLGTQGSNTNQANNILTFSTLGIARASFSQPDNGSGTFGGTQGNDLSGTIKLYLNSGTVITLAGALNWRETTGSTVEVFGFIFDPGQSATINYGSGQTYSITGGSTPSSSTTMGLKAYASAFTFVDNSNRSGNAATSGLLNALNAELANTPQPTSVVLASSNVTEGQNLVYTVTLSATDRKSVV